jgi:hypothetical protein
MLRGVAARSKRRSPVRKLRQPLPHRIAQWVQSVRRVDELAVEIETRGAPDTSRAAGFPVLKDAPAVDVRLEIVAEATHIQPEAFCKPDQKTLIELARASEDEIVKLPELTLGCGSFSRFGGQFGLRVDLRGRKVPIDEADERLVPPEK